MTFKPFVGDDFRATFSIFNKAEQIRLFLNPPALSFPLLSRADNQKSPLCVSPSHFLHTEASVWQLCPALRPHPALPPPRSGMLPWGGWHRAGSRCITSRDRTWDSARPDATHPLAHQLCTSVLLPTPRAPSPLHLPPKHTPVLPQAWPHVGLGTETRHQFTQGGWQLGALVFQG